jgi:RNA polymerase sigma-70 factor (ECF subfamily)
MRGGEPVGNSQCDSTFNLIYGQTYNKTLHYITARCGDAGDIADIMQEVYAELYKVLVARGVTYIREPEAFVMQLAKSKVFRHYSLREKIKTFFPVAQPSADDDPLGVDDNIGSLQEGLVDDLVADRILLRDIAAHIRTKPSDVQKIFYLHYVLEQTTAEIAHSLHLNESTVKSKIHRTVREVRTLYGKVGKET